jgi:hypothetical protein
VCAKAVLKPATKSEIAMSLLEAEQPQSTLQPITFVVITAPHFLHKLLGKFLGVYQQKARVSHTQTPIKETLYLLRDDV